MHTDRRPDRLTPLQHAALMDIAKARAIALRREAIDDFWHAAAQVLRAWRRPVPAPQAPLVGAATPTPCR